MLQYIHNTTIYVQHFDLYIGLLQALIIMQSLDLHGAQFPSRFTSQVEKHVYYSNSAHLNDVSTSTKVYMPSLDLLMHCTTARSIQVNTRHGPSIPLQMSFYQVHQKPLWKEEVFGAC